MSASDDRANQLIKDAYELRDTYRRNRQREIVTLFLEDFEFLKKRGDVREMSDGAMYLDGTIEVRCGDRKRRRAKRRPPEFHEFAQQ